MTGAGHRVGRALRRSAVALVVCATLAPACRSYRLEEKPSYRRGLVILGVDGMDPQLLREYMRTGVTPNLAALAERGSFAEMATTNPPQSPVAWSTAFTGLDAHGHGIFDFVHRDPAELAPYLSTSRVTAAKLIQLGPLSVPTSSAKVELLRAGSVFWQHLEAAGVPSTAVKAPANFPPPPTEVAESLSGMGTPDLLGTPGTFQLFTNEQTFAAGEVSGGIVHAVEFGHGQTVTANLQGPQNPLSTGDVPLTLPIRVTIDRHRPVALIHIGGTDVIIAPGEWSAWIPVAFDPGVLSGEIRGIVRFYLHSIRPALRLYASPINLDPHHPAMPLSSPPHYVKSLAGEIGRFYTQGMAEDTKALRAGALSDEEFLVQADLVFQERVAMLERELGRFRGGLLFFYFSSTDLVSHVFWRSLDPDAPPADRKFAHVIPELYGRVDQVIGSVLDWAPENTEVIVMSDHGFAPYRYQVHLNTWLAQHGYLSLLPADKTAPGALGHIDWSTTQAYALGLNQLFVNLRGREARGVVPASDRDLLLRRLKHELEAWRDPHTGARVIVEAVPVAPSQFSDRAPDFLIGYNRGYRSSDDSALGAVGEVAIERNDGKWSGDHCMHPALVPGVLLTTWPGAPVNASLLDLAPTVLTYFGVVNPAGWQGQSLWPASGSDTP